MKNSAIALALSLVLLGTLAACGTDRTNSGASGTGSSNNAGTNSANGAGTSGTGSAGSGAAGTANSSGASTGKVARRYDTGTAYNGRTYWDDGRYTAGTNGKVYDNGDNTASRDLTRDARDIVRDTGDAIGDVGRSIGDAARDITGMGNDTRYGTPSWEPDSSAVRY